MQESGHRAGSADGMHGRGHRAGSAVGKQSGHRACIADGKQSCHRAGRLHVEHMYYLTFPHGSFTYWCIFLFPVEPFQESGPHSHAPKRRRQTRTRSPGQATPRSSTERKNRRLMHRPQTQRHGRRGKLRGGDHAARPRNLWQRRTAGPCDPENRPRGGRRGESTKGSEAVGNHVRPLA